MKTKQQIMQGCGNEIREESIIYPCGVSWNNKLSLCPTCQAFLNQINEIEKKIDEDIKTIKEKVQGRITDNMFQFLDGKLRYLEKLKKEIIGE